MKEKALEIWKKVLKVLEMADISESEFRALTPNIKPVFIINF